VILMRLSESKHRKRVFRALEHRIPDRTPVDEPPGWRTDVGAELLAYLGARNFEEARRMLGIDLRLIGATFRTKRYSKDPRLFVDEWGIVREPTSTGLHTRFRIHPLAKATTTREIWEYAPFRV